MSLPTSTVQAPQSPSAQPSLEPRRRRSSRNQSSRVKSGATSVSVTSSPLSRNLMALVTSTIASAPAIGGIGEGAHQQRHVVVFVLGNGEADRHDVEEW